MFVNLYVSSYYSKIYLKLFSATSGKTFIHYLSVTIKF